MVRCGYVTVPFITSAESNAEARPGRIELLKVRRPRGFQRHLRTNMISEEKSQYFIPFHHFHPDVLEVQEIWRNMPNDLSRALGERIGLAGIDRSELNDDEHYYFNLPNVSITAAEGFYALIIVGQGWRCDWKSRTYISSPLQYSNYACLTLSSIA